MTVSRLLIATNLSYPCHSEGAIAKQVVSLLILVGHEVNSNEEDISYGENYISIVCQVSYKVTTVAELTVCQLVPLILL